MKIDGDVVLFWVTCAAVGVILAYIVASHIPTWCGS
jgi:hypothetical protein